MIFRRFIIILVAVLALSAKAFAQCSAENTAFNAGEELTYDLFFNWKFVWVSAGSATMNINKTKWEGRSAYKSHLITRTSSRLDRFFMMRDTMQSIMTEDMTPLYYKKGANEGGRYYVDEVWYSYAGIRMLVERRIFANDTRIGTGK